MSYEQVIGLEPTTSSLENWHSTIELHPQSFTVWYPYTVDTLGHLCPSVALCGT